MLVCRRFTVTLAGGAARPGADVVCYSFIVVGGRIETRTTTVIHAVDWLRKRHGWPGLNAIAMVESIRETKGVIEKDTRIYITSLVVRTHLLGPVIRSHWAIGNSLHWVMDMIFCDDECRVRTNHAPAST